MPHRATVSEALPHDVNGSPTGASLLCSAECRWAVAGNRRYLRAGSAYCVVRGMLRWCRSALVLWAACCDVDGCLSSECRMRRYGAGRWRCARRRSGPRLCVLNRRWRIEGIVGQAGSGQVHRRDKPQLGVASSAGSASGFSSRVFQPCAPAVFSASADCSRARADQRMRSVASSRESPATSVSQTSASIPVALRIVRASRCRFVSDISV